MPSISDIFTGLKDSVLGLVGINRNQKTLTEIPAEIDPTAETNTSTESDVVQFVRDIFEEGMQFELDHFNDTFHLRPIRMSTNGMATTTPAGFRRACEYLEAGNDHHVWGRRNDNAKNAWKQERVDGIVDRQMRVRRSYLCGNWHDIVISPNIQNISDIFDQERDAIGWGHFINRYVHTAQRYGTATARLIMDYTKEPKGHVKPIVCEPGTVVRTPHSASYDEADGCWYAVHGTMINDKQVEKQYPDIDKMSMTASIALSEKYRQDRKKAGEYNHTKMYAKLEAYFDDPTLIDIPFSPEEDGELVFENEQIMAGNPVSAQPDQNHTRHIEQKLEALSNLQSQTPESPEEQAMVERTAQLYKDNVDQHVAFLNKLNESDPARHGKQLKYPHGRYICTVGGVLAQDGPNPMANNDNGQSVEWRALFRDLKNEDVIGRIDGRGDPEILWNYAKTSDQARSRAADLVLSTVYGKKYRKINDKIDGIIEENDDDNDPATTGFYKDTPPTFVHGDASAVQLETQAADDARKQAQDALGVNSITIGGEPENQSSGYQTNLLQRQNEMIVTGEMDRNLREAVEDIVETMLQMYKVFYIEPRQYFINGELAAKTVSEILSVRTVVDQNGIVQQVPIDKFEITAKPFSNYPNKWEADLQFMMNLAGNQVLLQAIPALPEAIKDHLAQKYPEFGPNGKYGQMNPILQLGMQVAAQQQQAQAEADKEQKTLEGVKNGIQKKMLRGQMEAAAGVNGSNGQSQAQGAQ